MKSAAAEQERPLRGLWWWIDRWRQSRAYLDLSLDEQGAFRNILDEMWLRGGSIPNDPDLLAKACGDPRRWKAVAPKVLNFFDVDGKVLRNKTLTEVYGQSRRRRVNQQNYRARKRNNGTNNGRGNETDNAGDNEANNKADNVGGNGPITKPATQATPSRQQSRFSGSG